MTFAKAETPASTLRPRVLAASCTLIYLHYGLLWVAAAACVAAVIGRRALGEVEGSPVLSALFSVAFYSAAYGVSLFPVAMILIGARMMRTVSNRTLVKKDIKEPLETPRQIVRMFLEDPFMIGTLISTPFFMLLAASQLVRVQSPVEGSRREQIGLILQDVGILGSGAAYCFIMLPTLILRQWRMK
uniref:Uncharacterized protein n=1 Tax=Avena sativa TaxID=4498 RepID=A0ACD5YZ71_AVESA